MVNDFVPFSEFQGILRLAPTLQDDITPTEKHLRVNLCVSKAVLIASTDSTRIPKNRLVPTVWSMFLLRSQSSKDGVLHILRLAPTLQDDITPTEKHFRVNLCVSKAALIASTDGT